MSTTRDARPFGVLVPATNTAVEAEFNDLRLGGVSWHSGRMPVRKTGLRDDAAFAGFVEGLHREMQGALEGVLSAGVEHVVLATSAQVFWGGKEGAAEVDARLQALSGGVSVTTAGTALTAALTALGARTVGVVTPYQPIGDARLRAFLEESGFEVAAIHGLRSKSVRSVATLTAEQLRDGFQRVDGSAVDALVQPGTNLPCLRFVTALEEEFGKPVVTLNAALVWHAYRSRGIADRSDAFGSLFAHH